MDILNNINSPDDVKNLSLKDLDILSSEIRRFLVKSISKTGGHLASNLGVVELTLALHYTFDSPRDKIIWDVGHQSYVHKIITGRKEGFKSLRKFGGMSGFPKASESEHDVFEAGHSSTSISAGLGYAISRDLLNDSYNVISVIGDGSITSGLAYEGLNNAGRSETDMIIVLNDNQMSISENVGGITKHLNDIRTAPFYIGAKKDVNNLLNKMPVVGKKLGKFIERTKDSIKHYFLEPGILFEELGFKYIGPVDGHNIEELIKVFNQIKNIKGPILMHVYTQKGKGYKFAQQHPENYHGVSPFEIKTGLSIVKNKETYSDVLGRTLTELSEENENIVGITAAMPSGTGLMKLKERFPKRVFDVGIAESHAVTFAAGMAKNGIIPVVAVYSTFFQRSYDQILHDVCLQKLHVIFGVDRAGIVGDDGETHQGIYDISFLSHIPNLTILAPSCKPEFEDMIKFAVDFNGPIAIRYPRGIPYEGLLSNEKVLYSKSHLIKKGEEIMIISVGDMIDVSHSVYEKLKITGLNPTLVNLRFIKPLDVELIKSIKNYKHVFVLENNIRTGGVHSLILEELSEKNIKTNVVSISFPDEFIVHGTRNEIFKKYRLDSDSVYFKILETIKGSEYGNSERIQA